MFLPFLRPSALPRSSTILQLLRQSSTSATASPAPTIATTPTTPSPLVVPKPYQVLLSPSNQLPVYQHKRRGGNYLETKIKNITGNIQQLREDLLKQLKTKDEKDVRIKAVVEGQIIIKGHRRDEINHFFEKHNVGIKQKVPTI